MVPLIEERKKYDTIRNLQVVKGSDCFAGGDGHRIFLYGRSDSCGHLKTALSTACIPVLSGTCIYGCHRNSVLCHFIPFLAGLQADWPRQFLFEGKCRRLYVHQSARFFSDDRVVYRIAVSGSRRLDEDRRTGDPYIWHLSEHDCYNYRRRLITFDF